MLRSDEKAKKDKNARPPKKQNGIIVCTKYYVLEKRERGRTPPQTCRPAIHILKTLLPAWGQVGGKGSRQTQVVFDLTGSGL